MHQLQVHECMHAVSSFCFKELLNSCTHCEIISHNTFMQLLIQNNFQICSNCSASLHKNHITTSSTEPLPRILKLIYKNVPWMTLSNLLKPFDSIAQDNHQSYKYKNFKRASAFEPQPRFWNVPHVTYFPDLLKMFQTIAQHGVQSYKKALGHSLKQIAA